MTLHDRYTKHLVVSDSTTVNPSQMPENVILVNSSGQKISTKTDAELNSRYAPKLNGAASVGGTYYGSPAYTVTTAALVAGTLTATPWRVEYTTTVTRLRAEVTAGAVGSTVRLGIYASATDQARPDALVVDGGTIDGNSATAQEVTVSTVLAPGLYWLVGAAQGGTPTARILQGTTDPCTPADDTMSGVRSGWSMTGVTGALPANFSASPAVITNAVRVFARTNP